MENDQRLTPLPVTTDLHPAALDFGTGYTSSYDDTLDGKRSLKQYFNIVYKRLPLIVAITIIVTAAVAFYSYRQPLVYQARTSLIIEPRRAPQTQKDAININFGDDQKYYNTQLQLLQSIGLMKSVVIALGLHRDPNALGTQSKGLLAGLRSLFTSSKAASENPDAVPVVSDSGTGGGVAEQLTPEEARRANDYAGTLLGGLTVDPVERTNIVYISVENPDPALAARVSDKVAEIFIKQDADRETAGTQEAYENLQKSIEELKGTIVQEENDLITEMTNSGLALADKGAEVRAADLQALLTQYRTAQEETGKIQATYNAALAASQKGDILAVGGENRAIQAARDQKQKRQMDLDARLELMDKKIDELQEKRKGLLVRYTPEYRDVVAIDAQIKELQDQKIRVKDEVSKRIDSEGQQVENTAKREYLTSLASQLAGAQQREARQRAAFEDAASRANVEGVAETRLTTLREELKNNHELLNTYTGRQKEQELTLTTGRPDNIKVQNKAVAPTTPIGPHRTRNIFIALLLSLGAGIGLAFLLDYLDDSVRTSDDVSRHLGLPTLALIPHYMNSEKRKLLPGSSNGNGIISPSATALITMEERNSPMAEAYRHLRTSLLFSSAGKPPRTILVTSSQPSEGKTTTAINTAITLAQSDADVVIIDCDLRRPRLHSHFGMDNQHGLTNYLSGDKNIEKIIRSYPDLPRLKVITSGPIPPNPAELLSSNEMREMLQSLTVRFKHVIVDSPPAISFTDAAILSTLVDGVVLVAMANKSSIHLMRQFKQRVSAIGARIYGVVLNGIKSSSMDYDYYGSGYYKYYSQTTDDETPLLEEQQTKADDTAAGV